MKNKAVEYPHPVLNEFTNDFTDSEFSINVKSFSDVGNDIVLELEYFLDCLGLNELLKAGTLKIIVRITCYRTCFRKVEDLNIDSSTIISIPKKKLTDVLEIQASVVANDNISEFSVEEFNKNYFDTKSFRLRKGDIVANEPGIKIKLNTILEKNTSGVVQVTGSPDISEMKLNYADINETDPALSNYIVITLPDTEYKNYAKLMNKKHKKNGIERFLQAAIILPAITEAINKLRIEEIVETDDETPTYKGTIWADSIMKALSNYGIDELATCTKSDYELANIILGYVTNDAINNLMQKMTEWSTIRQEDDVL